MRLGITKLYSGSNRHLLCLQFDFHLPEGISQIAGQPVYVPSNFLKEDFYGNLL